MLKRLAVLTGSVAFGVAKPNTDEDWLISEDALTELDDSQNDDDNGGYDCDECDGFRSVRYGAINLIVYQTEEFLARWMKAHNHCLIEQPRQKERRVKIFRHYLYGEFLT